MRRIETTGLRCGATILALGLLWACDGGPADYDLLGARGFRATEGAAAGYLPDAACRSCHQTQYDSYQEVGMARSFARPGEARWIEDFGQEYYHEPSQRHYEIQREGDELFFRRWQTDGQGRAINVWERRVDWIMGSGNRARSYLYQTEWGELYELPLGWYSESESWAMSPGFEFASHGGVQRVVRRECMFCHNGLPEVAEGTDDFGDPARFPRDLPQGTGCQRCHGPGADHVKSALSGGSREEVRGGIVNPARLEPERRDSVCFQCHMLPAVALAGARRFDRADYSFRPGELLSDYLVHVETGEPGVAREETFEINHHGYRLWQSPCYQESAGELACFTCHDPHRKPDSAEFRSRVEGVCQGCHSPSAGGHPEVAELNQRTCVDCHMPTRRTRDVVLATMTDHRIARGPFDLDELVAPIPKRVPVIDELEIMPLGDPPQGAEAEVYRLVAAMRAYPSVDGVAALERLLKNSGQPPRSSGPALDLLRAQLKVHEFEGARELARAVLTNDPDDVRVLEGLGVAQTGLGRFDAAVETLERALAIEESPSLHYNLALAALEADRPDLAHEHLLAAIALRPNMYLAWSYRGHVEWRRGDLEAARSSLMRALEIEPSHARSYAALVHVLSQMERSDEAARYLAVGLRVAGDAEVLLALDALADSAPPS